MKIVIPKEVVDSGEESVQLYIDYFRAGYAWTMNRPLSHLDREDVEGRAARLREEAELRDKWPVAYDAGVNYAMQEALECLRHVHK